MMKILIKIGIFLTMLSTVSAERVLSVEESGKYNVVVQKDDSDRWAGVIINNRYVLSSAYYNRSSKIKAESLRIILGYFSDQMSIIENEKETRITSNYGKVEHRVLKHWIIESLMLLKTIIQIRFNERMLTIRLPSFSEYNTWKNPCNLPNKVKYVTTDWLELSNDKRLRIISSLRKCFHTECPQKKSIETCFAINVNWKPINFVAGAPLVYNNTLVGIRKHSFRVPPPEKIYEENFINVALYMSLIEDISDGDLRCY